MANPLTAGDRITDDYLSSEGYVGERNVDWRRRVGVQTPKDPDLLIWRAGEMVAIAEVKEVTNTPLNRRVLRRSYFTTGPAALTAKVRQMLESALDQLQPFAEVPLPLVAVIVNPYGVVTSFGTSAVANALFGINGLLGTGRALSDAGHLPTFDRHPYLAAVVVVSERSNRQDLERAEFARIDAEFPVADTHDQRVALATAKLSAMDAAEREGRVPAGEYQYMSVFDLSARSTFTGSPLPVDAFDGDRDRRYTLTADLAFALD